MADRHHGHVFGLILVLFQILTPTTKTGLLSAPSQTTGFLWTCTLGGKDHAVIHLYYARFLSHFCRDPGLVGHREPFKKLLVQGLNKGQTFRAADRGQYPKRDHMDFTAFLLLFPLLGNWVNTNTGSVHGGEEPVQVGSKAELQVTWEKMSKSKHNSLDPQQQYGIDTVRLYILYTAPPEQDILWDVKRLSQVRNPLSPLLSRSGDVLQQPWPTSDPLYLETPDTLELVVWTNNKVYGTVLVPQQVAQDTEQVQALVLGSKLGQHLLGYRTIKKAILFHRTALINFLKEEQPLNPGC